MVPRITSAELKDGKTSAFTDNKSPVYREMVVVITGASSGIGEAIAVTYASQGCHIVLAARRQDKLLGVAENCQKAGGTALCVECDVTKPADRAKLAKAAVDFANTVPGNTGVVHRLFLNAGVSQNSKFADLAESTEDEMMELNFLSNIRLTRLFLPILESGVEATKNKDPLLKPRLSVVSSIMARLPAPFNTIYCASKAALCAFFDCLRFEVSFGITSILPGPVRTALIENLRGPGGKLVAMVVDDPSVVERSGGKVGEKLSGSVIMTAMEAARIAALVTERGVREVTYPPMERAVSKIRYGNEEGQEVWEGPRSIGDTMLRFTAVPTTGNKL